jgi:hypothetical protein
MSRKTSTIKLTLLKDMNPTGGDLWRVDTVTDSTEFNPGSTLKKEQVDTLCASRDWKVTIGRDNRNV